MRAEWRAPRISALQSPQLVLPARRLLTVAPRSPRHGSIRVAGEGSRSMGNSRRGSSCVLKVEDQGVGGNLLVVESGEYSCAAVSIYTRGHPQFTPLQPLVKHPSVPLQSLRLTLNFNFLSLLITPNQQQHHHHHHHVSSEQLLIRDCHRIEAYHPSWN